MRFNKIAKPDTFLYNYMQYMQDMETPEAYDFWCGMWLLSNAIGRDCIINRPRVPVQANLYIVLAADSGITRKSTSISFVADISNKLDLPGYMPINTKIYPAKLVQDASAKSTEHGKVHIAFTASELAAVLNKAGYMREMPVILTDLYDCPTYRAGGGTVSGKGTELHNVYTTFIAATAPKWLHTRINRDIVEGGFTSRTFFIHEETRKRKIPWPEEYKVSRDTFIEYRVQDLDLIAKRARRVGSIEFTSSAIDRYSSWYTRRKDSETPYMRSFESREADHVLRVAAILSVNDDYWVIDKPHIDSALRLVNEVKQSGNNLFEIMFNPDIKQADKLVVATDKIKELLLTNGLKPTNHSTILRKCQSLSAPVIARILDVMESKRMVQCVVDKSKKGRPSTYWLGTKYLVEIPMRDVITQIDQTRL